MQLLCSMPNKPDRTVNFLISLSLMLLIFPAQTLFADNSLDYIQPEGLSDSTKYGFSHVVTATGAKTIYLSGQTARDGKGILVGGNDLEKQMVQVLKNIQTALASTDAAMQDVVRLEIYVVDWSPDKLPAYLSAIKQFFDPEHLPASTLIGIETLAFPEFLVEITATAVIN